jgi:TusA-related sulfurtransferase
MSTVVDARGLSCPQPVILALNAIRTGKESELEVLVDTDTSRENVSRAAASQGWEVVSVRKEEGVFRIGIRKK